MAEQERVLSAILAVAGSNPVIMSIHSVSATRRVIALLNRYPVTGAVLHWWRGTPSETEDALSLGCYFSLNGAEAIRPKVLDLIPRDRILTETDFPFSRRSDRGAVRPGITTTIEAALADAWKLDASDAREQVWRNFKRLISSTGGAQRMPRGIQRQLLLLVD
jgi:TatD DNase family protein